jgi:hypothetical protein
MWINTPQKLNVGWNYIWFYQIEHSGYYCVYPWDKNCFFNVWNMWSQPTYVYSPESLRLWKGSSYIQVWHTNDSREDILRIAEGNTRREEMLTLLSFMLAVVLFNYSHAKKHISFRHKPLKGCVWQKYACLQAVLRV